MILQNLAEYYENLVLQEKVSKSGWCQAKVSHAIELNEDGTIKAIISKRKEEERGKKKIWVAVILYVQEMVTRSSGVSSNFLCDNAKYFLGIDGDGIQKRTIECFESAKERHLMLLEEANGKMARAICLFFKNWKQQDFELLRADIVVICSHFSIFETLETTDYQQQSKYKKLTYDII